MHGRPARIALRTVALVLGLIWLVPLLWVAMTSLRAQSESIAGSAFPHHWTLSSFSSAWNAAPFGTYYLNTLIIAFGTIAVQLVTSTLAAYAFARMRFRFRDTIFLLYLLQMMIPISALIIPNYLTMKQLGLVDQLIAIMLPYFGSALGVFVLRQSFRTVPVEYEEAARMDGARLLSVIWHVYLPSARASVLAFLLITFSYHWDDFFWPLIVTSSDDRRPLTVGLALFTQASESGTNWQLLCAATLLVCLPVLVLFFVFQRHFVAGFSRSLH